MEPQLKSDLGRLSEALESGTKQQVERMLRTLHPAEMALLLESMPPAKRNLVWELVDPQDEGDILVELNDEVRTLLVQDMDTLGPEHVEIEVTLGTATSSQTLDPTYETDEPNGPGCGVCDYATETVQMATAQP